MKENVFINTGGKLHGHRTGCAQDCAGVTNALESVAILKASIGYVPREISIVSPCIKDRSDSCRVKICKALK